MSQDAIKKAAVLIEALPYIQRFRGETIVVKFGGSFMDDTEQAARVLTDIALMECVGMHPVVVHGGGKAISRAMRERGIESKFVRGQRVTCEETISVVQDVMNQSVNPGIVESLIAAGAKAVGLRGEQILTVTKMTQDDSGAIDLGFVGNPFGVDTGPIRECLKNGTIPVISPLGIGPDQKVYNINADIAAAAVARALKSRKLAFLTDVPGLLSDPKNADSVMTTLKVGEVEELIRRGVIDGGMLPKVQSGVDALRAGVRKVHIIDGRMPHSLLLEVLTDKGVGTEIIWDE
jgi:acetylglutamate kinase